MRKDVRVDYLQFSSELKPAQLFAYQRLQTDKSPNKFYKLQMTYEHGLRVLTGNPNSEKFLYILSGQTCDDINITPQLMTQILNENSNISRIDFAVTVDINIIDHIWQNREKTVTEMYKEPLRLERGIENPNTETIYFGEQKRRGKKGIVRVYDKGIESGIGGLWHRIELECKRKHAQVSAKRYAIGERIESIMNAKFRIDTELYKSIMSDEVSICRIKLEKHTTQDTEIERKMSWLMRQVKPTLQYVIDYDKQNGTNNFAMILDSLNFD